MSFTQFGLNMDGHKEKAQDPEEWISDINKWMLNGTQVSNIKAKTYLNYYWANRSFLEYNLFWVGLQYWGEQLRVCLVLPPSEIDKVLNKEHKTVFSAQKWSCCKNQLQSDSKLLVALYGQRYWRVHQTLWKISKTL